MRRSSSRPVTESGPARRAPVPVLLAIAAVIALLVVGLAAAGLVAPWSPAMASPASLVAPQQREDPAAGAESDHVDQHRLTTMVVDGETIAAFREAFERGDELFEHIFTAQQGVGANVGDGARFTRVPRADLDGPGEWGAHVPRRTTGPNAQSCNSCHNLPFDDGAGAASNNVHRDTTHSGDPTLFIQRNTPHLFGIGAVQRLAEEMTDELHRLRDAAIQTARDACAPVSQALSAKGVDFGAVRVTPAVGMAPGACLDVEVDLSGARGVTDDLVIRSFQWKGDDIFLREFNREAAHNELGMQAAELVGDGVDGDGDGVVDELTVGDLTALTVYVAAQPRPTTRTELASLGLIPPLAETELRAIQRGEQVFDQAQCAVCHTPSLALDDPVFREPSLSPVHRDGLLPAGQDAASMGLDPQNAVAFDLTQDQPDNQVADDEGNVVYRLGALKTDADGRAVVELFGDLKRHDMGPGLAEPIDEIGTGPSVFLTENLWGVGSTAPYLHDGRATTLEEAILLHGGEAAPSRDAFQQLSKEDQAALLAFLNNLVLFKLAEEEEELP